MKRLKVKGPSDLLHHHRNNMTMPELLDPTISNNPTIPQSNNLTIQQSDSRFEAHRIVILFIDGGGGWMPP